MKGSPCYHQLSEKHFYLNRPVKGKEIFILQLNGTTRDNIPVAYLRSSLTKKNKVMKKFIFLISVAFLFASCRMNKSAVQSNNFEQAMNKISTSVIKNSEKEAEKQAKQMKRQGYYVDPMGLPMETQLEKAMLFEGIVDNSGRTRYIVEKEHVLSRTPASGKQHALELAKLTLAGYLQSYIQGLVQTDLGNNQISMKEAESINKSVSVYNNWIAQNLGPVTPVAVLYKDHRNEVEVYVTVAYDKRYAKTLVSEQLVKKLEGDTNIAREKLEKVFNASRFDNLGANK